MILGMTMTAPQPLHVRMADDPDGGSQDCNSLWEADGTSGGGRSPTSAFPVDLELLH